MSVDRRLVGGALAWCLVTGVTQAQAPRSQRLVDFGGAYVTRIRNADSSISTEIQPSLAWGKLTVPVSLGGGSALLLGVAYEGQFISYSNVNTGPQNALPTALHALDATAGVVWQFAEQWSAAALFTPGIHSDLKDVTSRDLVWAGSLLFIHPFGSGNPRGDRNRIGFGAAFSDRFGQLLPFPLLLLDWYPSESWFLRGTLPLDLEVGYRLARQLAVGLGALLKGYEYRLTDAAPWFGAVIRYREFQLGPFLDYAVAKGIHVRASGGVAVGQHFEFRDESNSNTLVDGDFKSGGYFRGGIYFAY